ncbi:MAG: hypothetical protein KKB59_19485 [Spirochaetes bacterium]|nr:hypothetical protein [Spirochaetota bacterium]
MVVSAKKDKLMAELRREIEDGKVTVAELFEEFYGEIAKAPNRVLDPFVKNHEKWLRDRAQ